jgi:hypothetical protein
MKAVASPSRGTNRVHDSTRIAPACSLFVIRRCLVILDGDPPAAECGRRRCCPHAGIEAEPCPIRHSQPLR